MNGLIRQLHRWVAVAFVAGVIANTVVIFGLGQAQPAYWVYLLALIPLAFLTISGVYLFLRPYFARGRGRQAAIS